MDALADKVRSGGSTMGSSVAWQLTSQPAPLRETPNEGGLRSNVTASGASTSIYNIAELYIFVNKDTCVRSAFSLS